MYERLMEEAVTDENYRQALRAVKRNHGAPGIDRMSTVQLEPHLDANWQVLKDKLLKGTYVPTPVKAQDAVRAAQQFAQKGKDWVVDIDITKFFDHVNHDILLGRIALVVRDKRVLGLIGKLRHE